MPNVTATPRRESNGDVTTYFIGVIGSASATYTYPINQDVLKFTNRSVSSSMTLTVNGTAYTVTNDSSIVIYAPFTSFTVIAQSDSQAFDATATAGFSDDVQLTGSNVKLFIPTTATNTDKAIPFPFSTRQVLIINDGTDALNFAFDAKNSKGQTYLTNNAALIFTGTWAGTTTKNADNAITTNNVVFKPVLKALVSMTWDMIKGTGAGIAKIEISADNGTTWQNPSAISGVSRSDGATGTAMDTYDCYDPSASILSFITYNLPWDLTTIWAMRVSATNTKNASALSTTNIFINDFRLNDGSIFTVNSKENLNLEIQTIQINVSSPTSTTGRVIVI